MEVTRKEFFDYVVLNDLEKALDHFFSLDNILVFDDGKIFETEEEFREYYNEKERNSWDIIKGLKPDNFNNHK
jgi:hypothetical protein